MIQSHEEGDLIDLQQILLAYMMHRIRTNSLNHWDWWPLKDKTVNTEEYSFVGEGLVKFLPGCGSWHRWSLDTANQCCAGWMKNDSRGGLPPRCHTQPHDSCSWCTQTQVLVWVTLNDWVLNYPNTRETWDSLWLWSLAEWHWPKIEILSTMSQFCSPVQIFEM